MQKITPFLTFDHQAQEAATFYTSIFKNSAITRVTRYGEGAPRAAGTVMSVVFQLNRQTFMALNGGPHFTFTDGISLFVTCDTQQEVDDYWEKLTAGGAEGQCGWLKDQFGVSWQIVPAELSNLLQQPDPEKSKRVMKAFRQMKKIDLRVLEEALAG